MSIAISVDGFTEEANSMRVDVARKPIFSHILDLVDTYGVKAFGFNIMMSSDTFVLPQSYNEAAAKFIIDEFVELRERGIYEYHMMRKLKSFFKAQVYFSDCAATTGGQIVKPGNTIHSIDKCFCAHSKKTLEFFVKDLYRIIAKDRPASK